VERVHYYKFDWQHQQDRRNLGETYLFHPRWRMFVYKSNVGSSAITRPVYQVYIVKACELNGHHLTYLLFCLTILHIAYIHFLPIALFVDLINNQHQQKEDIT